MDYRTNSATRKDIRLLSRLMRKMFGYNNSERIYPLLLLDRLKDVFPGTNWEVVEDNELPENVAAECVPDVNWNFKIKIKESVYDKAYSYDDGASNDHIVHEICHIFLFKIGYMPIVTREYKNCELRCYESVEWQAKALCGEFMIPYEETINMDRNEIKKRYGVSSSQSYYREKKIK